MDLAERAEKAKEYGKAILKAFDDKDVPVDIAYAAIGHAFFNLHDALGYTKEDIIDLIERMYDGKYPPAP